MKQATAANVQVRDRPGWLQDANSMLVSAFCHLAAFIALGLLTVASSDGWRGVKLLVNLGDGGPEAPIVDGVVARGFGPPGSV